MRREVTMPEGQVLEFTHVTKRFNEVTAVSDFSARVEPGAVTAFLGPNGAGKTTTLRILLGQVRATSGTATIGGTAYAELRQPLRTIGAVLEETVYRPRRTAERQLTIAAKANGIPLARVGEVLSLVGLDGEGDSRIGGFSLGMRQRLSVAHALLGDPGALVFDEPANGLDPEGIRWMRLLMRRLADEGRTVLVSSHVLSEVEQVADNVLVLSKGKLVLASGIETLADPKGGSVIVDAADRGALTAALSAAGFDIEVLRSGLTVRGGDAGTVGAVAAEAGIALSTLVQRGPTLEDVFIDLMRGGRLGSSPATPSPLAAPAPAAIVSDDTVGDDVAASDAGGAPSAPVDSVVAVPVAAAAAWAAEAAAAPAGEPVADDLAAAVAADGEDADHDAVDELSADETSPAEVAAEGGLAEGATDEAPVTEAPADDASTTEAEADESDESASTPPAADAPASTDAGSDETQDEAPEENTPALSFDQILFGAAAPVAAAESTAPVEVSYDVAEIFETNETSDEDATAETSDESPVEAPADDAVTEDAVTDDATAEEAAPEEAAPESDDAADDDHAGVEIFADLEDTTAEDAPATEESESDGTDPRSAAVSSMLAAAARAYYEDEPKDYPLSTEESSDGDDSAAEGAHWSIASTGVIDTVPADEAAPSEDTSDHGDEDASEHASDDTSDEHEHGHDGEHQENDENGEHHQG